MITNDNIEIWILRYKDGELDAAENAMVEKALAEHHEWQEMADLYDPTLMLTVDESVVFPHKERLHFEKKNQAVMAATEEKQRKIVPLWRWISAAACIALLLGISIRWIFNEQPSEGTIITAETQVNEIKMENNHEQGRSRASEEQPQARVLAYQQSATTNETTITSPASNDNPIPNTTITDKQITITDKLVVYIDDDATTEEFNFSKPEIKTTDKLITYYEDEQPEPVPQYQRRTKTQFAEDMLAEVQLASLQFQTTIANKLLGN